MTSANLGAVVRRATLATAIALSFCSIPAHAALLDVDGDLSDLIAQVNTLESSGTLYNWAKDTDPLGSTESTESGNGSDIKDMFAHYDPILDILYLGMSVWGNVGTSGDLEGDPFDPFNFYLGGQAGVFDSLETYGFDIRFPANGLTQVIRFDVIGEEVDGPSAPASGFFTTNPYNLTVDWAVSVTDNGVEFSVAGLAAAGVFGLPYPNWPEEITLSYYAGSGSNTGAEDMAQMNMQVVPVPAAAWLLGSGLLGLIAAARRRS